MAKRGLETQILKIKPDPFQISGTKDNHMFGQNWSYDYVIAFAVTNEDEDSDDESRDDHFIREHSFAAVIAKLKKAKLETKCFFSRDRSVVFVKIRASLERLCRQANTVGYQLSLDEGRVRQRLCEGHFNSARKRYRWAPKAYPHELMAKAENDDWAKDNYFRGDGIKDYHEFMLVRDGSREAERMAEKDRKVVGRIYPIQDDFNLCKWKYWQHHFAAYTDKHAFEGLFKRDVQGTFSPFRGVDRLKLIKSILESDKGGCCHLRIGKLLKKKCILACFPLEDEDLCIPMQKSIYVPWLLPWRQGAAVEKIKDYHGEKIGLYFKFICKYSTWLFCASFFGITAFAGIAVEESGSRDVFDGGTWGRLGTYRTHGSSILVALFAVFVLLWSAAFLESWKNTQIETAMMWGMRGFELSEQDRPEFLLNPDNVIINSPVDGEKRAYFPTRRRLCREAMSLSVVVFFILLVICAILAVFLFKAFADPNQCVKEVVEDDNFDDRIGFVKGLDYGKPTMRCAPGVWSHFRLGPYYAGAFTFPEVGLGTIIASIMLSVVILIFNSIYRKVATILNDYENHRTNTEYEDALIAKTFLFQMVNSYGALAYIAFLKEPIVNRIGELNVYALCPYGQHSANMGRACLSELSIQLFFIFVVKMITDTLTAVVLPFVCRLKSSCWNSKEDEDNLEDDGEIEDDPTGEKPPQLALIQFDKSEYDVMMGPFGDYAELAVQFGYATLFTVGFPMAPLFAFINNYFQIRYDLYKISQTTRRPEPCGAEDLGTWQHIFYALSTLAVISNCALIVFTSSYLKDYQEWLPFPAVDSNSSHRSTQGYKWLLFFVMEHTILMGRHLIDFLVDDIPGDVKIQIARQELVTAKVIDDVESDDDGTSEEEEAEITVDNLPDMHVWPYDDDLVLKDHDRAEFKANMKWVEMRRASERVRENSRMSESRQEESKELN
eukprot:CAMPEP_0171750144 /NCGR_PEP_ID=MMETSP0991-20121206/41210_1 /TAXON_ID=483369 /ORGANISM="non described non described, Strain CCMP2098" /LENGTH=947 /DNA_ID=CAMNT_0012351009 /DNA_START=93 /DNA_END=2940 /DNA_ORIENTATION=+